MSQQTAKGKSKAAQHAAYKTQSRYSTNKRRKLQRHLKENPNDKCAAKAIEHIALYKRKAPKTVAWLKSDKRVTNLFRAGGDTTNYQKLRFDQIEQINSHKNELSDKDRKALENHPARKEKKTTMFQLRERLDLKHI